jgi:TetR/AcrR family tetracycline transcriptional repressor
MAIEKEKIVDAALQLLDEVGIDHLTTRKLAERLGVQQPALYWHFKNKQALIDAMNIEILRREHTYNVPRAGETWQHFLYENARSFRGALLSHRTGGRVHAGSEALPEDLHRLEAQLRILIDAGFELELAMQSMIAIGSFILGGVIDEQADTEVQRDWDKGEGDALDAGTPLLHEALHIFRDNGRERAFEAGMELIVTGLEAKLAAMPRRPKRPAKTKAAPGGAA